MRDRDDRPASRGRIHQNGDRMQMTDLLALLKEARELADDRHEEEFADRLLAAIKYLESQSAPKKDMLDACKDAVLKAAFGLKSLSEAELLRRLEDLYLEGVLAGRILRQGQR